MNRRQKIIVSVTGIFLVLLLLVGLTYAYFLTQITGNQNNKSILVSTANLAIVYGGDDGSVIGDGETIVPGTTFEPKTFTVTNNGNTTTDYVVVIEDASVTYAETIEVDGVTQTKDASTTFESNDFTYTLTCESGCNSVQEPTTFPVEGGILVGNRLDVGETQTYSLTLTYKETGENQTNDMNKKLEAKINIKDITTINPYSDKPNTLAYNIINNAKLGTTGTKLLAVPETDIAKSISGIKGLGIYENIVVTSSMLPPSFSAWRYADSKENALNGASASGKKCSELVGKYIYDASSRISGVFKLISCENETPISIEREIYDYEKVLTITTDDLGASYYYRGNVEDNYVEFNNMCWRIVRIEGDGSIKITLAAQKSCSAITSSDTGTAFIGNGHYGYKEGKVTNSLGQESQYDKYVADYLTSPTSNTTSMKYKLEEWYNTNLKSVEGKLKKDTWCLGNTKDAYDTSTNALLSDSVNDLMYNSKSFNYDTLRRLYTIEDKYATLRCDGNNYETHESYIGALTVDEVVFAGGKVNTENTNYYLTDNAISNNWWTLSLSKFNGSVKPFYVISGKIYDDGPRVSDSCSVRPSISLMSGITISGGEGTLQNPYVILD